jgi:sporulation protein YlmC with PRC-barrel domain
VNDLLGKTAVDAQAQVLGKVCDLEFNEKSMIINRICVKLEKDMIEQVGFKKPRLMGTIEVDVSIDIVQAIADFVSLTKSARELGPFMIRR